MKEVQTLIFDKKKFTRKSALDWAAHNDFKHYTSRITDNTIRVRQFPPNQIKNIRGTFPLGKNIKALYVDRK
jgi:hypothetical protein